MKRLENMYKDVISYKLAENVSEEHLLSVANDVLKSWMSKRAGFIKWEIHHGQGDEYTDIVYWGSEADAKMAEADMVNIPNAGEWISCYEEGSISSKRLNPLATLG